MNSSAAANIHYSSLADRYRATREYVVRPRIDRYYITRGNPTTEKKRGLSNIALLRESRRRGWGRSIARGNAEDRVLHLSVRAEQMAKFNAKPNELFANEDHVSTKQKLPLVTSTSFPPRSKMIPRLFSLFSWMSICEMVLIKLIMR